MGRVRWKSDQFVEERILNARGFVAAAFFGMFSTPSEHFLAEYAALSESLGDRMEFYAVNADENPTITEDAQITSLPTTIVWKDASEVARYEGPYSREALNDRLAKLMSKGEKA
jgi:thioredoxin-like negative regulator of GroEL